MKEKKYFIQLFGLIEVEVSKQQFIEAEKLCGFYSKIEGENATHGFGIIKYGFECKGRIEEITTSNQTEVLPCTLPTPVK